MSTYHTVGDLSPTERERVIREISNCIEEGGDQVRDPYIEQLQLMGDEALYEEWCGVVGRWLTSRGLVEPSNYSRVFERVCNDEKRDYSLL